MRRLLTVVVTLVCFPFLESGAVSISLTSESTVVTVGGSIEVEVAVSDMGDFGSPSLRSFDIDVRFDPAVLSFQSLSFGSSLGSIPAEVLTDFGVTNGVVDAAAVSLLPGATLLGNQPSEFLLATLTFGVQGPGPAILSFDQVILGDLLGNPLAAQQNGLTIVPEPATGVTVALGLLAMGGRKRSRTT